MQVYIVKLSLTILNMAPRKNRTILGLTGEVSMASSTTRRSSRELTLLTDTMQSQQDGHGVVSRVVGERLQVNK